MASFDMKLQPVPFAQVKAGTKTIEMRLNDEKRQAISVGDVIVFYKEPDLIESVTTRVVERLSYPTFLEMVTSNPPVSMGFEGSLDGYVRPAFYTAEDEQRYGALGLRLEVIGA